MEAIYTVYVMYSKKHDKIYIGYTSNLIERYKSHNKLSKKGWTMRYRPWIELYTEVYNDKKKAMRRETSLKSGKGRQWIKEIIKPNHTQLWHEE